MDIAYLLSPSLAPVQEQIISHLEPKDFLAMSLVSKAFRTLLHDALVSCVHNINGKLKKFFKNPLEFRRVQAETGTLIGGAFALSFMGNAAASPGTLDLFLAHDEELCAIVHILKFLEAEYQEWQSGDAKFNNYGGVDYRLQKKAGVLAVVMHSSTNGPLLPLLREATTTASLNFIAWNKAYSLFPRETFITKEAILLQNPLHAKRESHHLSQLNALTAHGILTKTESWDDECSDSYAAIQLPRRIGGKQSLIVNLDTEGIEAKDPSTTQALEVSTFRIQRPREIGASILNTSIASTSIPYFFMNADPLFQSQVLKHIYLSVTKTHAERVHDSDTRTYVDKVENLARKIKDVTMMEFLKLPEELRPVIYNEYIAARASWHNVKATLAKQQWRGDAVPEGWSWFDDLLVKQLDKFWDEERR